MDAEQIRRLRPDLKRYLRQFDDCFGRRDTRGHMPKYVEGQLSDLPRKSVEPMALKVGVPVRTLQEFLSQHEWDHLRMRDRLQQLVSQEHRGEVIASSTRRAWPRREIRRLACNANTVVRWASRTTAL